MTIKVDLYEPPRDPDARTGANHSITLAESIAKAWEETSPGEFFDKDATVDMRFHVEPGQGSKVRGDHLLKSPGDGSHTLEKLERFMVLVRGCMS
jgi:hypothetical protein